MLPPREALIPPDVKRAVAASKHDELLHNFRDHDLHRTQGIPFTDFERILSAASPTLQPSDIALLGTCFTAGHIEARRDESHHLLSGVDDAAMADVRQGIPQRHFPRVATLEFDSMASSHPLICARRIGFPSTSWRTGIF